MGPKKAPASTTKTSVSKAPVKSTGTKTGTSKVPSSKISTTAAKAGATKTTTAQIKKDDTSAKSDVAETTAAMEKATIDIVPEKKTEKPPVHSVPLKSIARFLFEDADGFISKSNWWPYCIDTKDIIGRFFLVRDVNLINGLDINAINAETIRKSLLGAIRFGKPFVFDMMGSDLYKTLEDIFEEILPGLMQMVLDRSILKDDNFMKIVKPTDSEEYQNKNEYDAFIHRYVFIVLTNVERQSGFTDKMMTVNVQ